MTIWLLAGTLVYFAGIMVPAALLFAGAGVMKYVGPRDELPAASVLRERALKADANFRENFPIFLGLGLLALVTEGADMNMAVLGAQMFVLSRIGYIPAYMSGVPFVRSGFYMVGWVGTIMMGLASLSAVV